MLATLQGSVASGAGQADMLATWLPALLIQGLQVLAAGFQRGRGDRQVHTGAETGSGADHVGHVAVDMDLLDLLRAVDAGLDRTGGGLADLLQ